MSNVNKVRESVSPRFKELFNVKWNVLHPKEKRSDGEAVRRILPELYDVALDAFGKWLPKEAIEERTAEASLVVLLSQAERIVGYAVNDLLSLAGENVNYFASGFLRREYQGRGLYAELNRTRAALLPASIMMTRTQNPIVYAQFRKMCLNLGYVCDPERGEISKEALTLARAYSPEVEDSLIVRGVYWKRSLMTDTPPAQGELEKKIWSQLHVEKGDAVIIVGRRKT
ncbi:hypothetical protein HYT55_01150 [Candidatus Woesearchaeota archaeon]|nr:hypothetical protein [Candidatus Woesearchaeota archaeon]